MPRRWCSCFHRTSLPQFGAGRAREVCPLIMPLVEPSTPMRKTVLAAGAAPPLLALMRDGPVEQRATATSVLHVLVLDQLPGFRRRQRSAASTSCFCSLPASCRMTRNASSQRGCCRRWRPPACGCQSGRRQSQQPAAFLQSAQQRRPESSTWKEKTAAATRWRSFV